jgi:altronate hydrolase
MADDMDVDASRILEGRATLDGVGDEIVALITAVASGQETRSEALGHREFILTYKNTGQRAGPACLPSAA